MAIKASYAKSSEAIAKLDELQFEVTQKNATEPRFRNEYWKHAEPGLYVDIVSGEPLFLSTDKFESKSGWPSFSKPVSHSAVVEHVDKAHGMVRTEVRSLHGDSHLGHVFPDGPIDTGGFRYCINSASLRFVPAASLQNEGYEEFSKYFVPETIGV